MVVIIDYGMGNLHSLRHALERVNIEAVVSSDTEVIKNASSLILPGVGAFKEAMDNLNNLGLVPVIKQSIKDGKFLLGICLGMQLLFERSFEFGECDGLGLIKGDIEKFDIKLKIPHMGWNSLDFNDDDPILKYINEGDYVYYVHSFYATDLSSTIASSTYEVEVPGIVKSGNVYGMQFHPEKSATVGENLLKAYKEIIA